MKKFFKIVGISFVLIFIFLLIAPFIFKKKIVKAIEIAANDNLNATLTFNHDIGLSFIKNFPQLSLVVNNLKIVGNDTFERDTLVNLPKLKLTLDLMSVIKGQTIDIKTIRLEKPFINILVLKNGLANYDITISDSTQQDTTESKFSLSLKSLEIEDGYLSYVDNSLPFKTILKNFDHELKGDFTQDNFILETLTKAKELTIGYDGINYIYKTNSEIDAKIEMDMKNMKFTLKDNDVLLNSFNLLAEGFVDMNDKDMDFDLKFKSKKSDFKTVMSLIPGVYKESFANAKASGGVVFDAYLKGKMDDINMPGYGLNLKVDNGYFQYPDLPKSINNANIELKVDNPSGVTNNVVINLSEFNANIAGEPINAQLLVKTPTTDPYLKGILKGNINLDEFRSLIPLEEKTKISGLIKADVTFDGHVSTLEKNYADFNASGNILAENFKYSDPIDLPHGTDLNSSLDFNPKMVKVNYLNGHLGKSDFKIDGTLNNLFGYFLTDQNLSGNLNLNSTYFNANEFLTDEEIPTEPKASDTLEMESFIVPANLDLVFKSKIDKVIYDNLTLDNLNGALHIKNEQLYFENVNLKTLGGTMNLDGIYETTNPKFPFSKMNFTVDKLDIIQTYNYLGIAQKFAPIAQYTQGLFNANINLKNNYNQDLSVNYPSVSGLINLGIGEASIKNLPILELIATQLKLDKLKNLSIKNLNFKLKLENGKMMLDSLILPLWTGAKAKISGYSALDQSIKYVAQFSIPRNDFGAANTALNSLTNQAKQKGLNITLSDIVDIDVLIGGLFTKPDVKISLHDAKKSFVDNVKNQLIDEAEKRKKAIEEEAKRRAEIQKQKAIDSLNKLKQQGIDKLNQQKKEAEQKVLEEKRKAEEKAKEEIERQKQEAARKLEEEKQKAKEKIKSGLDGILKK